MEGATSTTSEDRLLRRPQVLAMTGLSKALLYDLMEHGLFPRPVRIGRRAVAWWQSEVVAWMESRERTAPGIWG